MSVACRDWLKTLWPASFKGVPFYFEQDKETGGRGLVVHEFPNRDDPFVEDLGEAPRYYSGSAYVHGDAADALASALKAVLASRGKGSLVVPYFGPVTVHCETFERATQRDQMGYVAFELKFVRAGAATAFVSVPLLRNVAFAAADTAANLIGQLFPLVVSTVQQADYVIDAVVNTFATAASAIDVMRQTYPVDPATSATLRESVAALVTTLPGVVTNSAVPGPDAIAAVNSLVGIIRTFADAMPAASAVRATLELYDAFPAISATPYLSSAATAAANNADASSRLVRLACLIAYAEAVMRQTFASRPDGVTARGEVAERFEAELYNANGAENAALFQAIEDLQGRVIEWLTRTIADLAPVITVESAAIRPSLDLAWILYADPARGDELAARNQVRHPGFMPRVIEALAR